MELIRIVLIGFVAIVIFDSVGSVLSRELNFKYAWLVFGSFLIYGLVGFYSSKYEGFVISVFASGIIGAFDATIGLLISKKLNANIPEKELVNFNITPKKVFFVGAVASTVGMVAIRLGNYLEHL